MNVPAHTPIQEAIGRMLFDIENVPPDVARRMVSQTARMASEYVSNIEAERDRLREALERLYVLARRDSAFINSYKEVLDQAFDVLSLQEESDE